MQIAGEPTYTLDKGRMTVLNDKTSCRRSAYVLHSNRNWFTEVQSFFKIRH